MLTDPELIEIATGERGMLKGIDCCIETECLVSAVSLIYSAIDALSALTRPKSAADTKSGIFLAWVEKYMCPTSTLGCTAMDLYGARCGVLHNYGVDSQRRRDGVAQALIYKWKSGPDPDPQRATPLPQGAITICIEDLRKALGDAIKVFLHDVERDTDLLDRVNKHRRELLCYKPWSPVPIQVTDQP